MSPVNCANAISRSPRSSCAEAGPLVSRFNAPAGLSGRQTRDSLGRHSACAIGVWMSCRAHRSGRTTAPAHKLCSGCIERSPPQ